MQVGMVGLGRTGENMVIRMARAGHEIVVLERDPAMVESMTRRVKNETNGIAVGATSPPDLISKLQLPRVVWLMVPAGIIDRLIADIAPLLQQDDILIDGGNSYYIDDIRRGKELAAKGIHYLDVGTLGGVWGLERGYCLMIGGDKVAVERLDPIFKAVAPGQGTVSPTPGRERGSGTAEEGYLHCGPSGAGHFAKMVHNGIEFGLMAAYAEGLNILRHANVGKAGYTAGTEVTPLREPEHYQYDFDLAEMTELWRHSNLLSSWTLDLLASALAQDPELRMADRVIASSGLPDSAECRRTLQAAIDEGVPCNILSAALSSRFSSQQEETFAWQVLQAIRQKFGGH